MHIFRMLIMSFLSSVAGISHVLVCLLVQLGADVNLIAGGHTPLSVAVDTDDMEMVEVLLGFGASVNRLCSRHHHNHPLLVACKRCNPDTVHTLLKHNADANCEDVDGDTPLLTIIHFSNDYFLADNAQKIIWLLLEAGADLNHENLDGTFPLWKAIVNCNYHIAKMLIECGCNLNKTHRFLKIPTIFTAAEEVQDKSVQIFLYHGCRVEFPSYLRPSLLNVILRYCEPMTVELLLLVGYRITSDDWEEAYSLLPTYSDPNKCLYRQLKYRATQPQSLRQLCRTSVRRQLSSNTEGRSIVNSIPKLPLPSRMLQYIAMEHEFGHLEL